VRKGSRLVVRHGEREAHLVADDAFSISFCVGDMKTTTVDRESARHAHDIGALGCWIFRRSVYARGRVGA
jgi:hypothetical protein